MPSDIVPGATRLASFIHANGVAVAAVGTKPDVAMGTLAVVGGGERLSVIFLLFPARRLEERRRRHQHARHRQG